jgi:transposase
VAEAHVLALDSAERSFAVCAADRGGSFVGRQKNDAAEAAVIAEATLRPNMPFVVAKRAEHPARAVAFRADQCHLGQRTQLINALRRHLAKFGPE